MWRAIGLCYSLRRWLRLPRSPTPLTDWIESETFLAEMRGHHHGDQDP